MSNSPYKCNILQSAADIPKLIPKWQELISSNTATTPEFFQDPEYVRSFFAEQAASEPFIVTMWDGEQLKGIAPFFKEKTYFPLRLSVMTLINVPVRQLRLFGTHLLIAGDVDSDVAFSTLLDAIERSIQAFDLIYFENLALDDTLYKNLARRSGKLELKVPSAQPQVVRQLLLQDDYKSYLASRSSNTKSNIRRLRNKLERELQGTVELVRITKPEQVAGFLAELDQIFKATWQARVFGGKQRDTSETLHYFEDLARRGWLRAYLLRGQGNSLAYVLGFLYRGTYHYQEPGYDQNWAFLAPGSVLLHMMVEDLFEFEPPKILDFGFGENQYKRQFGNAERRVCKAYVPSTPLVKATLALQHALDGVYLKIRNQVETRGWAPKVRRLIKRKGPASAEVKNVEP